MPKLFEHPIVFLSVDTRVVGRPAGSVPGFNYTADHKDSPGTPPPSTNTSFSMLRTSP
jgi:hypothetical protein